MYEKPDAPQNKLKLRTSGMVFNALSWRYFLQKKSILEKFKMPRILRDYKEFLPSLILKCN